MSTRLRIEQRQSAGVLIFQLRGRLVAEDGATLFRDKVTAALDGGAKDLLIDLSQVDYIDSGGVGSLVAMFTRTGRRGGRLKLLCPSARACHVLEITGLLHVFDVFEDEPAALQSFTTPAVRRTGSDHRRAG
jgi:anti-sigma B factor antagonist